MIKKPKRKAKKAKAARPEKKFYRDEDGERRPLISTEDEEPVEWMGMTLYETF